MKIVQTFLFLFMIIMMGACSSIDIDKKERTFSQLDR
jgi:hypothetical protein